LLRFVVLLVLLLVTVPECAFGKFFTKDAYLVLHSSYDAHSIGTKQIISNIHYWLGAEAEMDKNFVAAFQAVQLANALTHGGKVTQRREFQGKETDAFYQYFVELATSNGGDAAEAFQHLEGGTESALAEVDFYQPPRLYNITVCMSAIMNEVACAKSSLDDDCCYILNSGQGCLYVWRGRKAPHYVRGAALELSFRMRQDQKGWEADEGCGIFKVEVVPVTQGSEPELFWEYLEDDCIAEEEIAAALKRAAALTGGSSPAGRRKSTRRASIAPELNMAGRRTSRQSIVLQMASDGSSPTQVSQMRKNSRRASITHAPLSSPEKKRNNAAEEEYTAQGTATGGGVGGDAAGLSAEQMRALSPKAADPSQKPRKGSTLTSMAEEDEEEDDEDEEATAVKEVAKVESAAPETRARGSSMSRLFGAASPDTTRPPSPSTTPTTPSVASPPVATPPVPGQKKSPSPGKSLSPGEVSSGGDVKEDAESAIPATRIRSLSKGWLRVKEAVKKKELPALQLKRRPSIALQQRDFARKLSNPSVVGLSNRLRQTGPTVQEDKAEDNAKDKAEDKAEGKADAFANWNDPDAEDDTDGVEGGEDEDEDEDEDYWDEAYDPNSEKTYYFHVGTGETSWVMPEGYVKPYHTSDEEDAEDEEAESVAVEVVAEKAVVEVAAEGTKEAPETRARGSSMSRLFGAASPDTTSKSALKATPIASSASPSASATSAESGGGAGAAAASAVSPDAVRRPTMRSSMRSRMQQPNWQLYKVSDDDIGMVHAGMPARSLLNGARVFVLDCQTELFVWLGQKASKTEEMTGLALAERLLEGAGLGEGSSVAASGVSRPEWVEAQVVNYGSEPFTFRSKFAEWGKTENVPLPASWKAAREKMAKKQIMQKKGVLRRPSMVARGEASKMAQLVKSLNSTGQDPTTDLAKGKAGSANPKRSSIGESGRGRRKSTQRRRSIDLKVAEAGAFDDDGTGELQMWHLAGSDLVPLPEEEYGHFSAHLSYVILYGFMEALDAENDEDAWGEAVVAEPSEGVSSPVQISDALTGLTATDGKKLRFICYFWGGRRAQGTDWMVWRMEAMPE
jgi:hypothetical protein